MKKWISLFFSVLFLCFTVLPVSATGGSLADVFMQMEEPTLLTVNLREDLGVNAAAYALMDINTGTLLAAKDENKLLYPASVTKVMTLLLVCEAITAGDLKLEEILTCSETASSKGGSQIWLEPGEEMTVEDLLKAAAVYSANDACTLLSERIGGSEEGFVRLMNEKAQALGMENTHFDNCTGLDDDTTTHLTTAYDVALMSRALMQTGIITGYTTIWMDSLRGGKTELVNTNRLVRFYAGATGLKTGTTSKAGCCVSATAERNGLGLIAVVMGAGNSNDRFNGARALLDYGFANYEIFTPEIDLGALHEVTVHHGEALSVALRVAPVKALLVSKGASAGIRQDTAVQEEAEAPVRQGDILGSVSFYAGDEKLAEYPLEAASDVPKLTFWTALRRILGALNGETAEKNEKKTILFLK